MSAPARTQPPDILSAFEGPIEPVPVPILYQVGLAAAALAMVLLPLLYLTLIAGVLWLVVLHLVHNVDILEEGLRFFHLIAYFGPAIAGAILALFMVKPFFAKPADAPKPTSLDPNDEPLLFAFVNRICDLVRAPKPVEIRVDSQVNASAGFRRGFLSMFSHDLVLTIGMPLAAGLRVNQLAGILAHEFGHFSQGAAMRLNYIVNTVNYWFARVVYQRDEWDVRLDRWAEEVWWRYKPIFWLSKFGVWLSRKILWALMMAGRAISSFLSRQMEYDADGYFVRLVGSGSFADAFVELELLEIASQHAARDLNAGLRDNQLPDDHAGLVAWRRTTFSEDAPERIRAALAEHKTSAFATHPATKDRIAAAEATGKPGVFHDASPATALFRDFGVLSRKITVRFYGVEHGLDLKRNRLGPLAEFRSQAGSADLERISAAGVFGGSLRPSKPLRIPEPEELPLEEAVERLRTAREEAQRLTQELAQTIERYTHVDERLSTLHQADGLLRAGFHLNPQSFDIATSSHEAVDDSTQQADREQGELSDRLDRLDVALEQRLAAAQNLIFSGASWLDVERARRDILRMRPALAALRESAPDYRRLKRPL